jgi:2-keto-3-deoxy-L-rhamnonate aldolase RhmA
VGSGLQTIPDPSVSAVFGGCGLDFVTVDGEHGEHTPSVFRACVDALKAIPAIVHPGAADLEVVQPRAGAGSQGASRPLPP